MRRTLILTACIVALSTNLAHAGPLTANQIISSYNLVTAGSATTNSDIEGNAVIGGNFNGATVFNNRAPAHPEIDIYGANQGNLNDNGGAVHYGSNTGTINLNGSGATKQQGNFPYLLSDFTTPLNQLSTQLAGLAANSTVSTGSSQLTFTTNPGSNGQAVFSLTAATLQADLINNSVVFNNAKGATSIIVDVSGNFVDPSGSNWNGPALQNVIFNFYNATSVTVNNWEASILAPNAGLSVASGNIEGFVYANSFAGGGEIHNLPFDGTLPVSSVPEPGTLLIFGVALLGLTALITHKRLA